MLRPAIITSDTANDLSPLPMRSAWVISGSPKTRAKVLGGTIDKAAHIMAWDCTPGVFNWHYVEEDEIAYILEGEVFITGSDGVESRLGPGDVALFPAGTCCRWRVTAPVKKIAILHKRLPRVLSLGVRAWYRFLRAIGLGQPSGMQSAGASAGSSES
jgi:uncharacterized protein